MPLRHRTARFTLFGLALLSAAGAADREPPNANRLKTGRFQYRTLLNGKDAGISDMSIRKGKGSEFIFTNRVTGEFSQRWEAIATQAFVPISARLDFGEGDNIRPAFELHYNAGRVTGFATARTRSEEHARRTVDAAIQPATVDQRIDWAAAMALDLAPGRVFTFQVFDAGTGSSGVSVKVGDHETVRVPAGSFDALRIVYRIEKAGGPETYEVLTNRTGRRMLLREQFPNGAVTELVKASN